VSYFRGWDNAGEYVDTGWSGAKASRPQLDRLMRDARLRRFDAVLVWKLDRWGRSLADCVRSIQELAALGVRFVAITQNIDTDESNPAPRSCCTSSPHLRSSSRQNAIYRHVQRLEDLVFR
jgi:putative DNA-invertase from lambdoid prophage Rac